MLSLDIPSFFIGAGIPVIVYILYRVYMRPVMPTNIFPVRTAGSRKEDKNVIVEKRAVRNNKVEHGGRIFRKGEYYNTPEESPLEKRYGGK